MVGLGEPRVVRAGVVGGSYFEVMGLRPVLGRLLDATDDGPQAAGAAVLTYRFWTTALGQRSVRDRQDHPARAIDRRRSSASSSRRCRTRRETEIIANIVTSPHHLSATMVDGRVHRMTELFGRLAPGVELDAARAELRAVHSAMVNEHPEAYPKKADFRIDAVRLRDQITSPARTVLLVLLAASALVFVIACSNVANLILARSVRREGELAIRAALGASAGALRRTLLAESLVLCGAGAVLGVLIAWPMVPVLARYAARFSVRALDLTRRCQPALGRRGPRARRSGPAGVRSATAVVGRGQWIRPVERQRADHLRHQPAAAAVCRDADCGVIRAAGRRRHAADDAVRAAAGAHRVQHPQRTGAARAGQTTDATAASRSLRLLQEAMRRIGAAAGRRAGGGRHARAVARGGAFFAGCSSPWKATRRPTAKRTRAARFRTVSPGFFASLGVPDHRRAGLHRRRSARQREGRHRQPEPGAADVSRPGCRQSPDDVDRSGDEVHRRQHRTAADRRRRGRRRRRERRARTRR